MTATRTSDVRTALTGALVLLVVVVALFVIGLAVWPGRHLADACEQPRDRFEYYTAQLGADRTNGDEVTAAADRAAAGRALAELHDLGCSTP